MCLLGISEEDLDGALSANLSLPPHPASNVKLSSKTPANYFIYESNQGFTGNDRDLSKWTKIQV